MTSHINRLFKRVLVFVLFSISLIFLPSCNKEVDVLGVDSINFNKEGGVQVLIPKEMPNGFQIYSDDLNFEKTDSSKITYISWLKTEFIYRGEIKLIITAEPNNTGKPRRATIGGLQRNTPLKTLVVTQD